MHLFAIDFDDGVTYKEVKAIIYKLIHSQSAGLYSTDRLA